MDTKNVVMLVGRLAADPELRYLSTGTPVATFAVAVNRSTRKPDGSFEDNLDGFFDCELFGGQAVAISESCKKGSEVALTGSLKQKTFKSKGDNPRNIRKVEIRVSHIAPILATPKSSSAEEQAGQEELAAQPA